MTTPAESRTPQSAAGAPPVPPTAAIDRRRMPGVRQNHRINVALVAVFAALIAVCALIPGFAIGPVPFVLTIVIVLASPLILGPLQAALAALLYIAVGLLGLPVFAGGSSGFAVLMGPTGGYLVGYVAAAVVAGFLANATLRIVPRGAQNSVLLTLSAVIGLLAIHACGVAGLMLNAGMGFRAAVTVTVGFLPLDLVKAVLAGMIAVTAFRAFPRLVTARLS